MSTPSLGPDFTRLWAAFAISAAGTTLAFDAFSLVAILVLHAGPAAVSALAAAGLATGALVAVPVGPWVEFRRKRPVMVGADLVRFAAVGSVPVAYLLGVLSVGQLLAVSVVVATSDIAFRSASGAYLKNLVRGPGLLVAHGRFESTTWTTTAIGPPLGGALIGAFGPFTTFVINAVSYLGSALGIRSIRGEEPPPPVRTERIRLPDVVHGWRFVVTSPTLRPLFANTVLVNALIMVSAPMMAVLMLGHLGFAPWQYGLAFGLPCLGGLVGARLSQPLVARFGPETVLRVLGTLRAVWPVGLVFVTRGLPGIALVLVLQFGLVTCIGIFNPVYATHRLRQTPDDLVARVLSAWTITGQATTAAVTALGGLLASLTGPRTTVAVAGVLLLLTPALLQRTGRNAARQKAQSRSAIASASASSASSTNA